VCGKFFCTYILVYCAGVLVEVAQTICPSIQFCMLYSNLQDQVLQKCTAYKNIAVSMRSYEYTVSWDQSLYLLEFLGVASF
jgi:hypothetical protein